MISRSPIATHNLFSACRPLVSSAGLARTLAECLYWSQHAQRREEGRPFFWKTGKELAQKLGFSVRTANEHLKLLSKQGFWEIRYQPRPGSSPSPVTWLQLTQRSVDLISQAAPVRRQRKQNAPFDETESPPSSEQKSDVQASENPTFIQLDTQENEQVDEAEKFILNSGKLKAGKKELFSSSLQEELQEKIKKFPAPSYAKATADDVEFFSCVQQELVIRDLPEWDWSSRFAWQHLQTIRKNLAKRGHSGVPAQIGMFREIIDKWDWLRLAMTERFSSHKLNEKRPSPMALVSQFSELLMSLENSKKPTKQKGSGPSSFAAGFQEK